MPKKFFAECECGCKIPVELFEAGTEKTCTACKSIVVVPNTVALKQASGDKYPLLSPLDKFLRALADRESPFTGDCQICSRSEATCEIPVTFVALTERHVSDDEGVHLSPFGGVQLVAGATEEYWQTTNFPFLLCSACENDFQLSQRPGISRYSTTAIVAIVVLTVFGCVAIYSVELAAVVFGVLCGLLWILRPLLWIACVRRTSDTDSVLLSWLGKIDGFPEVTQSVAEFKLAVGGSRTFDRKVFRIMKREE